MNMIFTNHLQQPWNSDVMNRQINIKDESTKPRERDLFGSGSGSDVGINPTSLFFSNFITRINVNKEGCSSCSGYK
jgi:hypothetical protein